MSEFQKAIKYCAIGLAVVLVIVIISGIIGAVYSIFSVTSDRVSWGKGYEGKTVDFTDTFTGVESLDLDNVSGELTIRIGNEFKIEATDVSQGFEARVTSDGTLKITENEGIEFLFFKFKGFNSTKSKITLYIPTDFVAREVKIDNGAGTLTIDQLNTGRLEISTGAGDIKGSNIIADEVEIDGGVGNLTLTNVDLRDAEIDCGVGDMEIEGKLTGENDIDCGVGSVELRLRGNLEDYELDIDSGVGSVRINGKKYKGSELINRGARHSIKIDGGIGDLDIDFDDNSF